MDNVDNKIKEEKTVCKDNNEIEYSLDTLYGMRFRIAPVREPDWEWERASEERHAKYREEFDRLHKELLKYDKERLKYLKKKELMRKLRFFSYLLIGAITGAIVMPAIVYLVIIPTVIVSSIIILSAYIIKHIL